MRDLQAYQEEMQVQQAQLIDSQRALELSRDRYADLFDYAPMGYVTLDCNGLIDDVNFAASRLLDVERQRSTGLPFLMYVDAPDRRAFLLHMHRCRRSRWTVESEIRLKTRRGTVVPVLLSSRRMGDGPTFLTAVFDLTERVRAERERLRAEEERHKILAQEGAARAANEAKDRFLATLSHELRTPLTPILFSLATLEARGGISDETRAAIEMIRRNIEHEARLIEDLLDVTRIARDRLHLRSEVVDVHALLGDLMTVSADEVRSAGIDASLRTDARRHHVQGDATRVRQVFWNLLKNAVRYTPRGGAIRIRTANDVPGRLTVIIADTGAGIAPDMLERIFAPFEQAGGRSGRDGLGLGLAICKGLVEAHGGSIAAASAGSGHGATFTVELLVRADRAAVAAPRRPALPARARKTSVLLVEDDPDSADALKESLTLHGYAVRVARSVAEAVRIGGRGMDVLISDIGLPDGSGLDVMRRLRHESRVRGIVLSGYGSEADVRASSEAGFARHLVKPIDMDALLREIEALSP